MCLEQQFSSRQWGWGGGGSNVKGFAIVEALDSMSRRLRAVLGAPHGPGDLVRRRLPVRERGRAEQGAGLKSPGISQILVTWSQAS